MKIFVPLLLVSVAVNVCLVVFLAGREECTPVAGVGTVECVAMAKGGAHVALSPEAWKVLAEGGPEALVKRLRTEGFPPVVILALLRAELNLKYKGELDALARQENQVPYWRTTQWAMEISPEARAARRNLFRRIYEEERRLAPGESEAAESSYGRAQRLANFGNLPREKVRAVEDLVRDYSDLSGQVRDASRGVLLAEDRERLAYLEKEKRADLAQMLSPEELEEYDRRNSVSAKTIQTKIAYLEASEEEYRRLYAIQKAFDDKYGVANLSAAQSELRREAEKGLGKEYAEALGPERYAEFQLVSDPNFLWTKRFVSEAGLAPETARALVGLERQSKEQVQAVRADKNLSTEERNAALAKLSEEAGRKVADLVGQDKLELYKGSAGSWLVGLGPASRSKAPN